jgi:hypothetical protein
LNDGECSDSVHEYNCACTSDWTGPNCGVTTVVQNTTNATDTFGALIETAVGAAIYYLLSCAASYLLTKSTVHGTKCALAVAGVNGFEGPKRNIGHGLCGDGNGCRSARRCLRCAWRR